MKLLLTFIPLPTTLTVCAKITYPNPSPTDQNIQLKSPTEEVKGTYELKNSLGVTVQRGELKSGSFVAPKGIAPGAYQLHVYQKGKKITKSIIIR